MSEADPYLTSYAKKTLASSASRGAAKRMRKESLNRGNRARDEIEAKAPAWKNEPTSNTRTPPKGANTPFQPGSNSGGLHFNMKRGR